MATKNQKGKPGTNPNDTTEGRGVSLGEALKTARLRRGWSLREMSDRTGLSTHTIMKWEKRSGFPKTLRLLLDAYGWSLKELQQAMEGMDPEFEARLEEATEIRMNQILRRLGAEPDNFGHIWSNPTSFKIPARLAADLVEDYEEE